MDECGGVTRFLAVTLDAHDSNMSSCLNGTGALCSFVCVMQDSFGLKRKKTTTPKQQPRFTNLGYYLKSWQNRVSGVSVVVEQVDRFMDSDVERVKLNYSLFQSISCARWPYYYHDMSICINHLRFGIWLYYITFVFSWV